MFVNAENLTNRKIGGVWTNQELQSWAPPEDITVSEWAEQYRVLPRQSAIPGPWRNRLTPYTIGVMDAYNDPLVEQITIMASVQSSKTEAAYNMLGYTICQDPAPALVAMPTLKTLKKVNRRLQSMLLASDELARHLTGNHDDLKYEAISLDRMEIHFATAGSESDLQFVEARILLLDEVDLYPPGAVKMAIDRSTTYWNKKIIKLSRPTTEDGHIYQEYQRSDKRKYWIPCPFCGEYQVLSFWQVKHKGEKLGEWPKDRRGPEYIKRERVARYECAHCGAEIDDADKSGMLNKGIWLAEGQKIGEGPPPAVTHAGFWWNVLYSPFQTFSEVAAEFFDSKEDPHKRRNFTTQWLAEPWKEIVRSKPASAILELRTDIPALTVPENTLALTAGIDSQKRGFWAVIRAWVLTPEGQQESHKIRHGFVASFGELEDWLFNSVYRTESQIEHWVWRGFIDTGGGLMGEGEATLTEQVYDWLRRSSRGVVFGCKGSSRHLTGNALVLPGNPIEFYPSGRRLPGGLVLWRMDTNRLKNYIDDYMANGQFHLDADTDEVYAAHLAAEHKERNKRGELVWTLKQGRDNHLLDCEVMAQAAAQAFNVWRLPRPQKSGKTKDNDPFKQEQPWLKNNRGWLER